MKACMSSRGTRSEKNSTGVPFGLINTDPIAPTLSASPSHDRSEQISQVLKLVAVILVGGAVTTLCLRNLKFNTSSVVRASNCLPAEVNLLSFLNACFFFDPCADWPVARSLLSLESVAWTSRDSIHHRRLSTGHKTLPYQLRHGAG